MEESKNNYCVYMHTSPSGKSYVGITCQKPERRWRDGEGYMPSDGKPYTAFARAILKYGWDNIKHEILYSGMTKEEACEMEIRLIKEKQLQNSQYGYNELRGGDVPMADCNESVREKMRESAYKKWKRPEYIEGHTGENHWTAGGKYSQKAIEAMRRACTGRKMTPEQVEACRERAKKQKRLYGAENKHSKPVLCFTKDDQLVERYAGLTDAYRKTGIPFQNISKACYGKYKTAGGYKWRFDNADQTE